MVIAVFINIVPIILIAITAVSSIEIMSSTFVCSPRCAIIVNPWFVTNIAYICVNKNVSQLWFGVEYPYGFGFAFVPGLANILVYIFVAGNISLKFGYIVDVNPVIFKSVSSFYLIVCEVGETCNVFLNIGYIKDAILPSLFTSPRTIFVSSAAYTVTVFAINAVIVSISASNTLILLILNFVFIWYSSRFMYFLEQYVYNIYYY